MPEQIVNIEAIKTQARAAVATHRDVNDACPYPFHTEAGRIFRDEFVWVRSVCDAKEAAAQQGVAA